MTNGALLQGASASLRDAPERSFDEVAGVLFVVKLDLLLELSGGISLHTAANSVLAFPRYIGTRDMLWFILVCEIIYNSSYDYSSNN
jgi:hypothetical protein